MNYYAAVHHHQYGEDVYLIRCRHFPTNDDLTAIVSATGMDYDPNYDEYVTFVSVNPAKAPIIEKEPMLKAMFEVEQKQQKKGQK